MGGGVVKPQCDEVKTARAVVSLDFRDIGLSAPDRRHDLRAVIGRPVAGMRQRMHQALDMDRPVAEFGIEIVAAVAELRGHRLHREQTDEDQRKDFR